VPPNLDLNRHKTSPLAQACPSAWLDMLSGMAGVLEPEGKWYMISRAWDETFGRTGHSDWRREALLGKTFYELFPDDVQRQMFRKLMASMAEGKLEQHSQVVEFGSGSKALHVQLTVRPLWEESTLIGYFVQGTDVTREHLNRLALLDRDRRMRELQGVIEEQKLRLESVITRGRERDEKLRDVQDQMEQRVSEHMTMLAQKTMEHVREVSALHEEIEKLQTENGTLIASALAIQALPVPTPIANGKANPDDTLRVLTAELAEEYGNLLTGVLGHSTLAAAEIGDNHAAVDDIHAIERAARTAAKLTRKLSALSGAARRPTAIEFGAFLHGYLRRNQLWDETNPPALPSKPCELRTESSALEVMLEGLTEFAHVHAQGSPWQWALEAHDGEATLCLHCDLERRNAEFPPQLLLAREVARSHGGEMEIKSGAIALSLPTNGQRESVASE
jgi:hypothetical protein